MIVGTEKGTFTILVTLRPPVLCSASLGHILRFYAQILQMLIFILGFEKNTK